ncbi:Zinc transporter 6 [Apodemus speciosus]|uniref:Zinc transporter 6 n=1 Tax=Apodemus speciosus TaxID=105296 RepID=A0ABQ0FJG2_APOSI
MWVRSKSSGLAGIAVTCEAKAKDSAIAFEVSLCSPGCPGAHSVDQADLFIIWFLCVVLAVLELYRPGCPGTQKSTCLCLPSAGITGVCHHARERPRHRLGGPSLVFPGL